MTDEQEKVAKILFLLRERDIKQSWLAKRLKTSDANISNWLGTAERGLVRPRDPGVYDRMLALLNPPESNFINISSPKIPIAHKIGFMAFAGTVPGGDWGDPLASEEQIEVNDARFVHPKRFATSLVGASCYPYLQAGDFMVWHVDRNPTYGRFVLAERMEDHAVTVKELAYEGGREILRPLNPTYQEPEDGEGWQVIARLVGLVFDFEGAEISIYDDKGITKTKLRFREKIVEES